MNVKIPITLSIIVLFVSVSLLAGMSIPHSNASMIDYHENLPLDGMLIPDRIETETNNTIILRVIGIFTFIY